MNTIELTARSTDGTGEERHSLPLAEARTQCSLRLRCLPGASALHVVLIGDGEVRLRAEVPAEGGESVLIQVHREQEDRLSVRSPGRQVVTLPPDERYAPVAPIVPAAGDSLDLALVVDGTTRHFFLQETEKKRFADSRSLLRDAEQWSSEVDKLVTFFTAATESHPDCRTAVLGFGDHPLEHAAADNLQPDYLLHPEHEDSRALRPMTSEQVRRALTSIPATSGGDVVDATADALAACVTAPSTSSRVRYSRLRWRPEARKLLLLFGDSPGHSILHPPFPGSDAGVRDFDVDQQAALLQQAGVELLTVYYDPPTDIGLQEVAFRGEILGHAQRQYRRLASLPQLAFEASTFEPLEAARRFTSLQGPIARGPATGELVEILPLADREPPPEAGSPEPAESGDGTP